MPYAREGEADRKVGSIVKNIIVPSAGDMVGIMGVDAGATTGLAWWCGEIGTSLKETFQDNVVDFGWQQVACGSSPVDEREGAEVCARRWMDLEAEWTLCGIGRENWYVVIEEFMLRPSGIGSTDRVGIGSARIGTLLEGMLVRKVRADHVARIMPSESKSFATADRLRLWGLWCRSAPHSRDAARLIARLVAGWL